ncbi:hypothetical protein GVAV_002680 [Gurleya vavrai]
MKNKQFLLSILTFLILTLTTWKINSVPLQTVSDTRQILEVPFLFDNFYLDDTKNFNMTEKINDQTEKLKLTFENKIKLTKPMGNIFDSDDNFDKMFENLDFIKVNFKNVDYSIDKNDTDEENLTNPYNIRLKRTIDLFPKRFYHNDNYKDTSIFARYDHDTYLDSLKPCTNTKMNLNDLQLINVNSFQSPIVYFIYFDESQYTDTPLEKINRRVNYVDIYFSLLFYNLPRLTYVIESFHSIDALKTMELKHLCNIQQFYKYYTYILLVFKDGQTFWFTKLKKTFDEEKYQNQFKALYDSNTDICEEENIQSKFNRKCCKSYAFAISMNKFMPKIFEDYKLKYFLNKCLEKGDTAKLSHSLKYSFEPKEF